MTEIEELKERISRTGVNIFLLGFPKCGTTALAEWLNQSDYLVVSSPKETYAFCPEFNDLQPSFNCDWKSGGAANLKVEACTWNVYSSSLMEALSSFPDIKVIIALRDVREVFPSWKMQVEKAGFPSIDMSDPQAFWDVHKEFSGFASADQLLGNYRTTLCFGYWVSRWFEAIGSDRVFLVNNDEMRSSDTIGELANELDHFLDRPLGLPGAVAEKNTFSTKRWPAVEFVYRSRRLKKLWFAIEELPILQDALIKIRYFIKEKVLMKKAEKPSYPLDFLVADGAFQEKMGFLDVAYKQVRGEH